MKNVLVLPLLAAVGLSLAACSREPGAAADANVTAENGSDFETAGDNISAVDEAVSNDTALSLDNGATPLEADGNLSNATDEALGNSAQ